MLSEFKADLQRYRELGVSTREIVLNPAVWAIFWHRFGHWAYKEDSPRILRPILKTIYILGALYFEALQQMRLDCSATIGPGLHIAHNGGIVLHPETVIGKRCNMGHQVTIGTPGIGRHGVPQIGDGVYVGTGSVLIGGIRIGDGARIAANSLVNRDVPAGATVMGVPAQIVKMGPQAVLETTAQEAEPEAEPCDECDARGAK
jgi:serine O-acetyltransferase